MYLIYQYKIPVQKLGNSFVGFVKNWRPEKLLVRFSEFQLVRTRKNQSIFSDWTREQLLPNCWVNKQFQQMFAKDSKSDYQLRNDPIFANMSFYRGRSLISKKNQLTN